MEYVTLIFIDEEQKPISDPTTNLHFGQPKSFWIDFTRPLADSGNFYAGLEIHRNLSRIHVSKREKGSYKFSKIYEEHKTHERWDTFSQTD